MWHAYGIGRGKLHIRFWFENMRDIFHLDDLGVDGKMILNLIFKKWAGGTWTGLIWLRIETGGGIL